MSSDENVKRSHATAEGGHTHAEIMAMPEMETLRDPELKLPRSTSYNDTDIYYNEKEFNDHTLRPMFFTTPVFYVYIGALMLIALNGLFWWGMQIFLGLGMANIHEPMFWGMYIIMFVFWVGLSHSGAIVSSILRLSMANWRRPILRAAEALGVLSLMVAGLFPLVHVGRLWRAYYMVPLPSQRMLWPNFKSPLMWDFVAINTYLFGSMTFLYIGLLPDIAIARDKAIAEKNWRRHYLTILGLGWRGGHREWSAYNKASWFLAIILICIAPSVHTIVSWDFAMTMTPGWHTTIFGPYFFVGAIYAGTSAVIALMIILRWWYDMKSVITQLHIDCMCKLLIVLGMVWTYLYINDFNVTWYSRLPEEWEVLSWQYREYGPMFYIMLGGALSTIFFLSWRRFREWEFGVFFIMMWIQVDMFIERWMILTQLCRRDNPFMWTSYFPSYTEFSIAAASFAYFFILYSVFIKLFPVITMCDVKEGVLVSGDLRLGRHMVRVQAKE
jgi:molybdopterin-containing oxidoreductase family membrane subunit